MIFSFSFYGLLILLLRFMGCLEMFKPGTKLDGVRPLALVFKASLK